MIITRLEDVKGPKMCAAQEERHEPRVHSIVLVTVPEALLTHAIPSHQPKRSGGCIWRSSLLSSCFFLRGTSTRVLAFPFTVLRNSLPSFTVPTLLLAAKLCVLVPRHP